MRVNLCQPRFLGSRQSTRTEPRDFTMGSSRSDDGYHVYVHPTPLDTVGERRVVLTTSETPFVGSTGTSTEDDTRLRRGTRCSPLLHFPYHPGNPSRWVGGSDGRHEYKIPVRTMILMVRRTSRVPPTIPSSRVLSGWVTLYEHGRTHPRDTEQDRCTKPFGPPFCRVRPSVLDREGGTRLPAPASPL